MIFHFTSIHMPPRKAAPVAVDMNVAVAGAGRRREFWWARHGATFFLSILIRNRLKI
jgi:hypothetical protein